MRDGEIGMKSKFITIALLASLSAPTFAGDFEKVLGGVIIGTVIGSQIAETRSPYYYPPPAVYGPPPQVVYAPPPVIYSQPQVIYRPAPVYYGGYDQYGYQGQYRHHGQHRHHGHHWNQDRR